MRQRASGTGRRVWVLTALLLIAACQPPAPQRGGPAEKKVRAEVMTIRTSIEPSKRKSAHSIFISGTLARSSAESGIWRLYDLRNDRVITVDDVERTFRSESFDALLATRRQLFRKAADDALLPRMEARPTGASRTLLGLPAAEIVISAGAYRRQLWFATHPRVPAQLFAMTHVATEVIPSQEGRQADEFLAAARGYPLAERTELPYGAATMVIERVVQSVAPREVAASLFEVPRGYRDVTVKAPAARRPGASSRPRGRTAPAAESRSSSTTRTAP